ncbi:glycosyltransferase [Thermodesulfobacterium hydrogeniphilum]|uniref:glycosyltransferase n=1 Tax=Thermodesulfobacterium hydrogeniphilum TaxID=161156 RepID=UPI0005701F31|nr:glycosyltransferase [Thermodesulfobacterium hydrogeniphilum]
MKIVHIVEPFAGGTYDFLVDLTNNLSEYRHIIIHGKRENTPENFEKDFPPGTEFIYWQNATREINPKKDLNALFELLSILKKINDIDIIHLHSSKAGFLGRLVARILGLSDKIIYTSHGVSFLRKDVSKLKQRMFVYLEKFATKLGGRVVACSRSEAEEFRKYGINAEYIYNGVDCGFVNYRRDQNKNIIIIGTIGRITYQKNPILFNEIAEYFSNKKNVKFLWIGDGESKEELKSKNIEITGWLPKEKVSNYLNSIDIYLSTSLWEGLPLSVLQAMCKGKPLVLSDCVGNRDLVKNNVNGFLYKTKEEAIKNLEKLICDSTLRLKFGQASLNIVKKDFSVKNTVSRYKELYKKVKNSKDS